MPFSGTIESVLASSFAAFCALWFVLYQGHVRVVLADRSTWASVLQHKCGLALVLALIWALGEAVLLATAIVRERRQRRVGLTRATEICSRRVLVFPVSRAAQTGQR